MAGTGCLIYVPPKSVYIPWCQTLNVTDVAINPSHCISRSRSPPPVFCEILHLLPGSKQVRGVCAYSRSCNSVCVCVRVCDAWQNTKSTSHQGWKDQLSFYLVCDILRWLVLKLSWCLPRFCFRAPGDAMNNESDPVPFVFWRARRNWADHPQYLLSFCSPPKKCAVVD